MFPEHVWEQVIGYITNSRDLENIVEANEFLGEICRKQLVVIKRMIFPAISEKEIERLDFVLRHIQLNRGYYTEDENAIIEQIESAIVCNDVKSDSYSKYYGERYKFPFSISDGFERDDFLLELAQLIMNELTKPVDYNGPVIMIRNQSHYYGWPSDDNPNYVLYDCPEVDAQFLLFMIDDNNKKINTLTLFERLQATLDTHDNSSSFSLKFSGYYKDAYPMIDIM